MGVIPTALATRRIVTASAPSLSRRRRLAIMILRFVNLAVIYTSYTKESKPKTLGVHIIVTKRIAGHTQVNQQSSIAAIQQALREGRNPDYTIVVFPTAPHTFVERPKAGEPFRWPCITSGYADLLASWVLYRESGK